MFILRRKTGALMVAYRTSRNSKKWHP